MRVHVGVKKNLIRGPEQVIKRPNYLTRTFEHAAHHGKEDGCDVVVAVVVVAFVVRVFSRLLWQEQQQKGMKSLSYYFPGLTHEPVRENNNLNKISCHLYRMFLFLQDVVNA